MTDATAPTAPDAAPDAAPEATIEAEIDRILMDSFPASDPPQWDSLAAGRLSPRPPAAARASKPRG